jgi:hypothetical protein
MPVGFTGDARGDASLALNRREILAPDHPIQAKAGETLGRGVEIVVYVEDCGARPTTVPWRAAGLSPLR